MPSLSSQLIFLRGKGFNPYHNLAIEEYLLDTLQDNSIILYLWQNKNTVVIGKNQNAWREANVAAIERDGCFLARRPSGGGAVYHDIGNLNFTFVAPHGLYSVEKQQEVILLAARAGGITAVRSGRNDIEADGRKFSGNAFYHGLKGSIHHGTLLVNVDVRNMGKYLNVPKDKIQAKGVDSVRSRVVNLNELSPGLTVEIVEKLLIAAFASVYGGNPIIWKEDSLDAGAIARLEDRFSRREWRLGADLSFEISFSHRFSWGGMTVSLTSDGGRVTDARVDSDAMDADYIEALSHALIGAEMSSRGLSLASEKAACREETKQIAGETAVWLASAEI